MHKLIEYICDELEELERKVDKGEKLSMSEIEYADTLAHMKKNLLKSEEMWEDSEYSMADGMHMGGSYRGRSYEGGRSMRGGSYARGGRGGSRRGGGTNQYGSYAMGGYSRAEDDFRMELQDLMEDAPNEQIKQKMRELMNHM